MCRGYGCRAENGDRRVPKKTCFLRVKGAYRAGISNATVKSARGRSVACSERDSRCIVSPCERPGRVAEETDHEKAVVAVGDWRGACARGVCRPRPERSGAKRASAEPAAGSDSGTADARARTRRRRSLREQRDSRDADVPARRARRQGQQRQERGADGRHQPGPLRSRELEVRHRVRRRLPARRSGIPSS